MKYTIKLFGPLSRAHGGGELVVIVESGGPTCREMRNEISARDPRLASFLDGCRFAVNGCFVAEEQTLAEEDEIALIGFVSGG